MVELQRLGGVAFDDLRSLKIWRVPVAQLLHAKMPRMLLNAASLSLIGGLLERRLGCTPFFLFRLVAAGLATVISRS